MPIVLTSLLRLLLTGLSVKEIFTFQETTAATSGYRVSTSFWHNRCPECIFVSSLAAQPIYISRRFSSDFIIVTSSANSRSLPTGMPIAMRVTFTPSGFTRRER